MLIHYFLHHLKVSSTMSTNKTASMLTAIKPYKQGWRIQVKLLHSWRQKTNYGGDTLELIFADERVRDLCLYINFLSLELPNPLYIFFVSG